MKKTEELGIEIYKEQLSNGSPIFLFKKKGSPIHIEIIYTSGARFGKKPGISHFLEHMIVSGSKKYPTKDLLCTPLENIGGSIRARTGSDFLYLEIDIADKEDIYIASDVINESINESLFNEQTIENERKAIFAEMNSKKSNPGRHIQDIYKKIFFQGTVLENSGLGTYEVVSKINKDELVQEYKRLIKNAKPIIIVSGDINISDIKINFDQIFEGTEDLLLSIIDTTLPIINKRHIEIENGPSDQVQMIIGFRTGIFSPVEEIHAKILSTIIATGRTSILAKELRYKKGLVYSIYGSIHTLADYATWSIGTSADKKHIQEVMDDILSEIDKIRLNGITKDQLDFARSRTVKSLKFSTQTSSSLVYLSAIKLILNQKNPYTLDDFVTDIENVTTEDILKCAQKIFNKDNLFVALYGNIEEKDLHNDRS
jgi:predicted Zn-dependent peptidase